MSRTLWTAVLTVAMVGVLSFCFQLVKAQEEQPHTEKPSECVKYCYPKGGPETRPKGTPAGIPGYECKGDRCSNVNEDDPEGDNCSEADKNGYAGPGKCSVYCARACCSCMAVCL
jgi:hypothetical protein